MHTVTLALINYLIQNVAYLKATDFSGILNSATLLVLFFLLCASMAMVVVYISELHGKMEGTITENLRLLNGMHEGVLILDEESI